MALSIKKKKNVWDLLEFFSEIVVGNSYSSSRIDLLSVIWKLIQHNQVDEDL